MRRKGRSRGQKEGQMGAAAAWRRGGRREKEKREEGEK